MAFRRPNSDELRLIGFLISAAKSFVAPQNWECNLRVKEMDDGGMGSLRLLPDEQTRERRVFGSQVSECKFTDSDGTEVIASLNLDDKGDLYELDIWKTDFGRLLRIPALFRDVRS
jgi:hypothetical protein